MAGSKWKFREPTVGGGSFLFRRSYHSFVAWKIRKHLTRVLSLLSVVNDLEAFLSFVTLNVMDDWDAYPESCESDEVRQMGGVSLPDFPQNSFQSSSGRSNNFR